MDIPEGKPKAGRPRIKTIAEESLFRSGFSPQDGDDAEPLPAYRIPYCHIVDEAGRYRVYVELPGMPPEAIDLEVGSSEIKVSADPANGDSMPSIPPYVGELELLEPVDPEATSVEYRNGLLTVTLEKVMPETRRRIPVAGPPADPQVDPAAGT